MHSNGQAQASKEPIFKGDILIVDDKPDNLRFLSATLIEQGYEVRCVLNGSMALTSARTTPPNLILLDIKMPELDGYEVCQQFKASPVTSDIPVIFLSALDETIDKVRAFAVGGVDYITKPFQMEEVLARIENQMAFQSAKAEILQLNTQLERRVQERTRELAEAKQQAEAANRAKDNFIAHISHELRTPLNSIIGFSNILQKDPDLKSELLNYAQIVYQSGQHLLTLINDLLDFSKIEAGKLQLSTKNFNLLNFLHELIAIFALRTSEKGLNFSHQLSSTIPVTVQADETRLRQILLNLLSNAVKFTETGGITLAVFPLEASVEDKKPPIRFQVEDTGIGIPADKLTDIFRPFQQLDTHLHNQPGTGLGLSITQTLLQAMNSEIQLASTPGEGSRFWFDLELIEVDAPLPTTPSQGEIETNRCFKQLKQPCKVLVVDDNDDNRHLLISYLKPRGFMTEEADNGEFGLTKAASFQPDVILLDLMMPVMNGQEMTQKIRQDNSLPDVAIFIISANSKPDVNLETLDFNAFISKPVDLENLLKILETHLQLEWITTENIAPQPNQSTLVAPPQNELLKLLESVEMGDVDAIEHQTKLLEELDSQYLIFAQTVRRFTSSFQIQKLEHMITALLAT